MIGILCSRIRFEEKALFEALRRRGIAFERLDEDRLQFAIGGDVPGVTGVLDRPIHHGRSLHPLTLLNPARLPTVNSAQLAHTRGHHILTSSTLAAAGV